MNQVLVGHVAVDRRILARRSHDDAVAQCKVAMVVGVKSVCWLIVTLWTAMMEPDCENASKVLHAMRQHSTIAGLWSRRHGRRKLTAN